MFLLFTCQSMNSFSPLQSYSTFMAIAIVTNPIIWCRRSRSAARTRQRGVPQPEIPICSSDLFHNWCGGAQDLIATSQRTAFFLMCLFQLFQSDRQLLVCVLGIGVSDGARENLCSACLCLLAGKINEQNTDSHWATKALAACWVLGGLALRQTQATAWGPRNLPEYAHKTDE